MVVPLKFILGTIPISSSSILFVAGADFRNFPFTSKPCDTPALEEELSSKCDFGGEITAPVADTISGAADIVPTGRFAPEVVFISSIIISVLASNFGITISGFASSLIAFISFSSISLLFFVAMVLDVVEDTSLSLSKCCSSLIEDPSSKNVSIERVLFPSGFIISISERLKGFFTLSLLF